MKIFTMSLFTLAFILSGCSYKAELVSQKDNSVHYGTLEDFTDTFDFTIRGEHFSGKWIKTGSTTYSMGLVDYKPVYTTGVSYDGAMLKQRGDKGSFLACTFTVDHSVDYGVCEERKNNEKFDITIK